MRSDGEALGKLAALALVAACYTQELPSRDARHDAPAPTDVGGYGGEVEGGTAGRGGGTVAPGAPVTCDFAAGGPCVVGYCNSDDECHGVAVCVIGPKLAYRCDDSLRVASMRVYVDDHPVLTSQLGCWNGAESLLSCVDGQRCRVEARGSFGEPYSSYDGACQHGDP